GGRACLQRAICRFMGAGQTGAARLRYIQTLSQQTSFLLDNMTPPELIIFDLGHVLVDFDFKKVIRNLKRYSPYSEKEIRHYFSHTPLWDRFERGQATPEEFFQSLQKDLKLKGLTFEPFAPLWNRFFSEKFDTVSILQRL